MLKYQNLKYYFKDDQTNKSKTRSPSLPPFLPLPLQHRSAVRTKCMLISPRLLLSELSLHRRELGRRGRQLRLEHLQLRLGEPEPFLSGQHARRHLSDLIKIDREIEQKDRKKNNLVNKGIHSASNKEKSASTTNNNIMDTNQQQQWVAAAITTRARLKPSFWQKQRRRE